MDESLLSALGFLAVVLLMTVAGLRIIRMPKLTGPFFIRRPRLFIVRFNPPAASRL